MILCIVPQSPQPSDEITDYVRARLIQFGHCMH
jgi:hypothetical protein